jgi:hypothetical protein
MYLIIIAKTNAFGGKSLMADLKWHWLTGFI